MRYLATLRETEHEFDFEKLDANTCMVRLGEQRFELDLRRVGASSFSVLIGNRSFDFDVTPEGEELIVTSRTGSWRLNLVEAKKMENEIKTPKAGRVIEVRVTAGQTVEKGEVLAIIE